MITILAFYVCCAIGMAAAILLAAPYYQEIGDCVSGLFRDAMDAINKSDDNGGNER